MQGDRARAKKQLNTPKKKLNGANKRTREENHDGCEKIPRAYIIRVTLVPQHRVAIMYPPLEVMRHAIREKTKTKAKK